MARILISDSHDEDRRLLSLMLVQLGHEPVTVRVPGPEHLTSAELVIVDPGTPLGAVLAQAVSFAAPSLPLLCTSWGDPPAELAQLRVSFAASLRKPLSLEQLDDSVDRALRIGRPSQQLHRGFGNWRSDDRAA